MKKATVALVLALTILASSSTAFAAEPEVAVFPEDIIEEYQDISMITPGFSTSGTTGTYSLIVSGSYNVTYLSVTLQVQARQTNGSYANFGSSWTASANNRYLYTSGTKTVTSGGAYRLKVTVYATTPAGTSAETAYSA